MNRYRKRTNILPFFLMFILLLMGIGYAYLSSSLSINGSTSVTANTWDIHFANIQVAEGSVPIGEGRQAATIDSQDNTLITYSVVLDKPGDYYEFTADIVNAGQIDGMIEIINSKVNNQAITNLPSYLEYSLTYADGNTIAPNHLLSAGETETIKVRVGYKEDLSSNELVGVETTLTFTLDFSYLQSDENAVARPTDIYIYRNDEVESIVGETISLEGTYYRTEEDMLSHSTSPFFIRHTVGSDNIIKASHIGVYLNGVVYYILGGELIKNPNTNTYEFSNGAYDEIAEVMEAAFADGSCDGDDTYMACQGSVGFSWLDRVGHVNVNDADLNCRIDDGGWSNCEPI